jgi:hypothetical protein
MMREDAKIVVQASGDQVLIGNAFHTLSDETRAVYETNVLDDFVRFVTDRTSVDERTLREGGVAPPLLIYYNHTVVEVYAAANPTRHTIPMARCNLEVSSILLTLLNNLGKPLEIGAVETFLRSLRPYLSNEALMLLDNAKDLKISKVVKIEQTKDNAGNITFAYKREAAAGQGDFTPPQVVAFRVPVYEGIEFTTEIETEFFFGYNDSDGIVSTSWKFLAPLAGEIVKVAKRKAIEEALGELMKIARYGTLSIKVSDDSWRFKENKAL